VFTPVFRGRPVPDAPALKATDMRQIGFLIARKQFGDFRLTVDCIRWVVDSFSADGPLT